MTLPTPARSDRCHNPDRGNRKPTASDPRDRPAPHRACDAGQRWARGAGTSAIADAELERALADPNPLRGIAQLTARQAAAFLLDSDGVTRTKALGADRMARQLRDALPGGESALRIAIWEFMRPMLSPALIALNRDGFVPEADSATTVDLAGPARSSCALMVDPARVVGQASPAVPTARIPGRPLAEVVSWLQSRRGAPRAARR